MSENNREGGEEQIVCFKIKSRTLEQISHNNANLHLKIRPKAQQSPPNIQHSRFSWIIAFIGILKKSAINCFHQQVIISAVKCDFQAFDQRSQFSHPLQRFEIDKIT